MAMIIPVYLVVKGTGQFDENGQELTIILDVKLTQASAQAVANRHEGAIVAKMKADKLID